MKIYTTPSETIRVTVESEDADGPFSTTGVCVRVVVPEEHIDELLGAYDPSSSTSPLVAYSRPIARAVLDNLKSYVEGGNR